MHLEILSKYAPRIYGELSAHLGYHVCLGLMESCDYENPDPHESNFFQIPEFEISTENERENLYYRASKNLKPNDLI